MHAVHEPTYFLGPNSVANSEELPEQNQAASASLGCGVAVLIKTPGFNLAGVIEDIEPHSLSILVKRALAVGSKVAIEFGELSRDGVIVSCRRRGRGYEASIAIPDLNEYDLRAADRFPVTHGVQICTAHSDEPLDALVTDLSVHGIGLETCMSLDTGETVTVESVRNIAFGIVHYCRRLDGGRFHAGVEVFHVMPKDLEVSR